MKDKQRSTLPMKDKHTPGPWWVSESGSIEFQDGYLGEAYDFNGTDKTDLPMMANARLMAAAPELFDTLHELYEAALVMNIIPLYKGLKKAQTLFAKLTDE